MRRIYLPGLLVVLLLACLNTAVPVSWFENQPGDLLFQDDFSDPSSGWDQFEDTNGSLGYQQNAYRIRVNGAHQMLWASPELEFNDVRLEVDVTKIGDTSDDDFGLVCRAQDEKNFYYLVISSDGYYGIGKVKDGVQQLIASQAMPPGELIHQGSATNHLGADCQGQNLALYVNGNILASVQDTDFTHGDVGLLAGTLESDTTEVIFDNFTILAP